MMLFDEIPAPELCLPMERTINFSLKMRTQSTSPSPHLLSHLHCGVTDLAVCLVSLVLLKRMAQMDTSPKLADSGRGTIPPLMVRGSAGKWGNLRPIFVNQLGQM